MADTDKRFASVGSFLTGDSFPMLHCNELIFQCDCMKAGEGREGNRRDYIESKIGDKKCFVRKKAQG